MPKKDLWTYLSDSDKKIVMYGMGNGADKIIKVCEKYGIEIADFFASDGFVRGHSFHGKVVLSYSQAKEKYGKFIVLLSFAFVQVYNLLPVKDLSSFPSSVNQQEEDSEGCISRDNVYINGIMYFPVSNTNEKDMYSFLQVSPLYC